MKTIAVTKNLIKRTWWEELLFGQGGLQVEGVPHFASMPEELLQYLADARDTAHRCLQSAETIAEASAALHRSEESLCDLDKTFALDLRFLKQHAEAMM